MAQKQQRRIQQDLRWYIAMLRRHKFPLLIVIGLTVTATLAFTAQQTPEYTSTTKVLVKPVGVSNWNYRPSQGDMSTEAGIATSEIVGGAVQKSLDSNESVGGLLGGLSVKTEKDTPFLYFDYTDPDPARAEQMSTEFADAYIKNRSQSATSLADQQKQPLVEELAATRADIQKLTHEIAGIPITSPKWSYLNSQLVVDQNRIAYVKQQLLPFDQPLANGGEVIQRAALPTSPSSPNYPSNLAIALLVGLVLGVLLASVRERLDDRLRGSRDLDVQMGAPILATIPKVDAWKKRETALMITRESPKGPTAEAYRTLRTNLDFIARDGDFRVLLLTSPVAGEGKTTTVANVAATLAQTGKRVIAVSLDLRKPRLHRFFSLSNAEGVTSILRGESTLGQSAQKPEGFDTLRVLGSGPVPSNPAEMLASAAMNSLMEDLRTYADIVVLDTPPVLAVSDALILAPKCDGVVVIADSRTTSRAAAAHAREQLGQVGANIVGCVLNNFDPHQVSYYPSSYRDYYYAYPSYHAYEYVEREKVGDLTENANGHRSAKDKKKASGKKTDEDVEDLGAR